ncbi:MAG: M23 family metallopeptidase [Candidatus Muirbacterium halophilum]|nr:M23 family metallopeptidase [Candidatus Muirbacterium halophilum]
MKKHPFTWDNLIPIIGIVFLGQLFSIALISLDISRLSIRVFSRDFSISSIKKSELFLKNNIQIAGNEKLKSLLADEINNILIPREIVSFQKGINIEEYKVKAGDSLWTISRKFKVSAAEILKVNVLQTEILYKNQVINIPIYTGKIELPDFNKNFIWPVNGIISSSYGYRKHPISGKADFHDGIDIIADKYTPIKAVESGVVTFAGYRNIAGKTVIIEHLDGFTTFYAHCDSINVDKDQIVHRGETIAKVGKTGYSTGYHLHFGMKLYDTSVNPIKYLKSIIY